MFSAFVPEPEAKIIILSIFNLFGRLSKKKHNNQIEKTKRKVFVNTPLFNFFLLFTNFNLKYIIFATIFKFKIKKLCQTLHQELKPLSLTN